MVTWRCSECNTILAKMRLTPGSTVQIKCGRCNAMNDHEQRNLTAVPVPA